MQKVHEYGLFTLDAVSEFKDIGIQVTSDFKWADECAAAAKKAMWALFRLESALSCRNAQIFVRPHIEF